MVDVAPASDAVPTAWQPLTFGGVARFGSASIGRLWLVQGLFAVAAAATIVWFAASAWAPLIRDGMDRLPAAGAIRNGKLEWPDATTVRVADNRFVAILVTPSIDSNPGQVSDLQVEFGATEIKLRSIFGFLALPYPAEWNFAINRATLEPWWGAWRPAVYSGIGMGVVFSLFLGWSTLAFLYMWPARLLALFADRPVTLWSCWKLCGAALMPGALVMTLGIFFYGLQRLSLPTFLVFMPAHIALGWVYAFVAPMRLPKIREANSPGTGRNPFLDAGAPVEETGERKAANPFSRVD